MGTICSVSKCRSGALDLQASGRGPQAFLGLVGAVVSRGSLLFELGCYVVKLGFARRRGTLVWYSRGDGSDTG